MKQNIPNGRWREESEMKRRGRAEGNRTDSAKNEDEAEDEADYEGCELLLGWVGLD